MVAKTGNLPFGPQNFFSFFRNFADSDGRSLGESPEQRQRIKLSPQIYLPPIVPQNTANVMPTTEGLIPGWGARQTSRIFNAVSSEVLPISINLGFAKKQPRGQSYVGARAQTGRWENLGTAPADGTAIGFDYWEKILLFPDFVDLGNVVSNTEIETVIRNSFRRESKSITNIDNNAGAGITVSGSTPPASIAPLFDKIYTITVSTDGPPNIDGTIEWTTTTGILVLTITGTRITIFPYPPQSEIVEELEWLTDVLTNSDGSEQRHSLRVNPRQLINYDVFSTNQFDVNSIRSLMIDWTTRVFGVPIWWNEIALVEDVTASDTIITVRPGALDTSDFRIGGLAMVYQEAEDGTRTVDTLQISNIVKSVASPESTQNQITFATPVLNNYDGSIATVIPVYPGILSDGITANNYKVGDSAEQKTRFRILDNLASVAAIAVNDYSELADFDGKPTLIIDEKVFLQSNNFSEKYSQKGQIIDFGTGEFTQLTQQLRAKRVTPFRWIAESEAEHWLLRALLYHLRGRWKSVWLPTWRNDFTVITNIGSGANTIDVENQNFAKFVKAGSPYSGIRVLQKNGTISYHRLTAAAEINATTDRLTIDPVFGTGINADDVERVDLMILSRLTNDKVSITHNWIDAESDVTDVEIDGSFIGDIRG